MSDRIKESLWTKNYTVFFISSFFMSLGVQFLMPTLPVFAMDALGADQSKIGYLLGAYSFAALVIRPYSGYAFDYIGRKKTYVVALVFFTLATMSYPFAATFFALVLFRFIHGLCFGMTSTGSGAIVGDILPPERRGEGVGYFGLANTLSGALGPAIGLWIMGKSEYLKLFMSSGALIGIALLMSCFIKLPKHTAPRKKLTWDSFFEKRVLGVSSLMMMIGVVTGGVLSYIVVYSKEIGIANGGLYFMVSSIGVAITRLFAGKVLDKSGPKLVISFGFIALSLGLITLSLSNGMGLFLTSAFLIGLGNGTIMPTLQTMLINMVEPEKRGVANSTFFAATDIGVGGGSIVLGWMTGFISLKTMFLFSGLFIIIPFLLFLMYVLKDYQAKILKFSSQQAAA